MFSHFWSEFDLHESELVPQTPQISVLNEKTPELGVSTASKMILKILAKNIKFEKS